jgi:hypothetical protein
VTDDLLLLAACVLLPFVPFLVLPIGYAIDRRLRRHL